MFMMIENKGIAPLEGFTLLGVSTARGDSDKIGQFGTGNKQAINVLLRNGLNPTIFLDTKRLQFFSETEKMGSHTYHRVYYKLSNRKPQPTGFSLEFGEIDWTDVSMALREFVSNAIDQSSGNIDDVVVKVVNRQVAKKGTTRIFIPLDSAVQKFVNELDRWFLHWSDKQHCRIIDKPALSMARIYRKGVFVREIAYGGPSLFDYNFGDDLTIDECRNLSDFSARHAVGMAISKDAVALAKLFRHMRDGEDSWEARLGEWELTYCADKEAWRKAWYEVFGDAVVSDRLEVSQVAKAKGFSVVEVDRAFFPAVIANGITAASSLITKVESSGNQIVDVTPGARETLNTMWDLLEKLELTGGKSKPNLACFSRAMDGGVVLCGYYESGTVYINVDNDNCRQTILEELAHYVTGSTDLSRDFQQWAFQMAARMTGYII